MFPFLQPGIYDAETPGWRVQVEVQDAIDLVLLAPLLPVSPYVTRRGSKGASLFLGGALMYAVYTFAICAFAVRFTTLFVGSSGCARRFPVGSLAKKAERTFRLPRIDLQRRAK